MLKISAVKKLRDFELEVDISVPDCETVVLMGNNGSGKTTVLNLLSGIMTPDAGHIEESGNVLYDSASGIDVPPENRNMGYVFQNYALFPQMTVFDNVAFGLRMRRLPFQEIKDRVRAHLESVGMWQLKDERASKLSGGQKQRVALARAIVIGPRLLILDEPLSALDAGTQTAMREELRTCIKNIHAPSILVTHNIRDAFVLGDVVYIMDRGKIIAHGKPGDILKKGHNSFIDNFFS